MDSTEAAVAGRGLLEEYLASAPLVLPHTGRLQSEPTCATPRKVLIQEMGVMDALRFLNQFRAGHGDYTVEREQSFQGETVKSIVTAIKAQRTGG